MSFTQGISGLNAAAADLDTIGNNIANSKTTGFKGSSLQFADVYASARIGLGVNVAGVTQNFGTGPLNRTDRELDVAIDGGGFFRLSDNGLTTYSRDGHFIQTKDGQLANAQGALLSGYNVTGFNGNNPTISVNGDPQIIQLPDAGLSAHATSEAKMAAALDAGVTPIDPLMVPFDPDNAASYHWATPIAVYDSLGNAHSVTMYFTKTDLNEWVVNGQMMLGQGGTTNLTPFTLQFDNGGRLDPGTALTTYTVTAATLNNGAATLTYDFDFTGSTQTAQSFSSTNPTQDGYTSGLLTSIAIQEDGTITGSYDNGQRVDLAKIALANFRNVNGLRPVSGNAWVETFTSGQPAFGTAGNGQFGFLRGGVLEDSNVDMAQELVNLIVSQRNYQANAQTIKTQDQMMQTLVSMR